MSYTIMCMHGFNDFEGRLIVTGCVMFNLNTMHHFINGLEGREIH